MKISCDVISDLLPLYYDNVCSEDSKILVEEHLAQCESCREELKKFDIEIKYNTVNLEDGKAMKKIAKAWKQDKAKAFTKGVTITSLLMSVMCLVMFNVIGSEVLEDGTLVEPFILIPLFYLFAFIALISGISLFFISKYRAKQG